MKCISLAVNKPSLIQHLDISFNSNVEISATNFTKNRQRIVKNNTLKYLNLLKCGLQGNDMGDIILTLSECTALEYLNFQSCTIPEGVSVGCLITNNKWLKYFDVSDCKLQQDEIITIAECLRSTYSIEHLILTSNLISEPAAKQMALTFQNTHSLRRLALSKCALDKEGMLHIMNALHHITSLQHLELSYNSIDDETAISIASALANNLLLEYLDLSFCSWSKRGQEIIHRALNLEIFRMIKEADFRT